MTINIMKGRYLSMLMDIKCFAVPSVRVDLTFDDGSAKDRLLGIGDLISVDWNASGVCKHMVGEITAISTAGTDPKGWYIIVDGSDDFASLRARFSPMSILDVEILRKADTVEAVRTPLGCDGVQFLRIKKGRLQYSHDGINWHFIRIDDEDIIEDQDGTVPLPPGKHCHKHRHGSDCGCSDPVPPEDDGIEESSY